MPEKRTIKTRLPVEFRDGPEGGAIEGYAAVYYDGTEETEYQLYPGIVERIARGAFKRALDRPDNVLALFNHNPDNILGRSSAKTLSLWSDRKGLRYRIERGRTSVWEDVEEWIRRGELDGSSFSFEVEKAGDEWSKEDGDTQTVRTIRSVKLYDVGPVAFPAYAGTSTVIRSMPDEVRASWLDHRRREASGILKRLDADERGG